MKAKSECHFRQSILVCVVLCLTLHGSAQTDKTLTPYPKSLPYSFSNFVWWSDDELRGLLKSRISGLTDEIAPSPSPEGKIRDVLKGLLKEKGIIADVQSIEQCSLFLTGTRAPGAPSPSIAFSVISPKVLIDKVLVSQAPENLTSSLNENRRLIEGHEYSSGQDWLIRSKIGDTLDANGYMEAKIEISHDAPRHIGDHFAVNLILLIEPGPQYRISTITADGGPLLQGRDLTSYITQKPGDLPGAGPFGRLAGELRSFYWHYGYADVDIEGPPSLDRTNSLVSYHLEVIPGPLYHLRSLVIHNLSTEQEAKARELLKMKPGDIYDETAVNALYQRIRADQMLETYGFGFSPQKDKSAAAVDLTLDFYKVSDKSSVTVN